MSFEICPPGTFVAPEALQEGEVTLRRDGRLTVRVEDLRLIGAESYVLVLADVATQRIALRAPLPHERPQSVACGVVWAGKKTRRDSLRRTVSVAKALDRLGLTAEAVAGRRQWTTKGEKPGDALLILQLTDLSRSERADVKRAEQTAQEYEHGRAKPK